MNTNYIFNLLFNSLEYLVKIYGRMVQKMEYILINIIPTILAHTENTSKLYIVRFVNYRKKLHGHHWLHCMHLAEHTVLF